MCVCVRERERERIIVASPPLKVACGFERANVSRNGITPSHYVLHSKPRCVNSPTNFAVFDGAVFSISVTFRDLGDHICFLHSLQFSLFRHRHFTLPD